MATSVINGTLNHHTRPKGDGGHVTGTRQNENPFPKKTSRFFSAYVYNPRPFTTGEKNNMYCEYSVSSNRV